jgi:cytochrome d ubiquinol oxidase subunit II
MFENLSYSALQHYWWILVAILGAALVTMMFVLGGQAIYNKLGETENEKSLILNAI